MNSHSNMRAADSFIRRSALAGALLGGLILGMPAMAHADAASDAEQYVSDAAITARVKTALVQTDGISGLDVEVETNEGVVQLSGFVDDEDAADLAADVAQRQEGVREVKNDIRVKGED
jgi:hyperosmotically inducible periplasmic protein